jgi:hypothetical protein
MCCWMDGNKQCSVAPAEWTLSQMSVSNIKASNIKPQSFPLLSPCGASQMRHCSCCVRLLRALEEKEWMWKAGSQKATGKCQVQHSLDGAPPNVTTNPEQQNCHGCAALSVQMMMHMRSTWSKVKAKAKANNKQQHQFNGWLLKSEDLRVQTLLRASKCSADSIAGCQISRLKR